MRSLGSTAASPSWPVARPMKRAPISRPRWHCPPARIPAPAMRRAQSSLNSLNSRAPSRPGSPRQEGEGLLRLLRFGLLRLLHRLFLGGLLLHLHRDRCAGGDPHRPRVAVGDVVGGHLQALGGGNGLLHGGLGHHLEAVAGLLALGLGRKAVESITPLLGAGHQARMQLSGQLPDHDIQVGVRHVVLSSSKTVSMRADYADRARPWQFPAARHPQLPVTKTKKPRYARGSLAWFGVFCLTSARRPGRLSLPDRGRSRTRPPDICNSPAASP